jgi:hypothetical protein
VTETRLTRYLTRYQEVAKSQNQVPNLVPGSWKNGKPGTLPGTRNLTKKFWPYFLVRPDSYLLSQEVTGFYNKILVVDNLKLVGYSLLLNHLRFEMYKQPFRAAMHSWQYFVTHADISVWLERTYFVAAHFRQIATILRKYIPTIIYHIGRKITKYKRYYWIMLNTTTLIFCQRSQQPDFCI